MKIQFQLIPYELPSGEVPLEDFLVSLHPKHHAKVLRDMDLLRKYGLQLPTKFIKHLDDGIYELRSQFSNNIFRICFFYFIGNKIMLTHGFIKKTQKTPKEEMLKAKKLRNEFYRRVEKGEISI